MSELESVRNEKCQNREVPELEMLKLESVRMGKCQRRIDQKESLSDVAEQVRDKV